MIFVKFIVLFGCIVVLSALQTYYCDLCLNHTLCLYNIPGPSVTCNSYDTKSLLSKQDIDELVDKINERRNYIATGNSGIIPQAANMKIIHWSSELATFAQRWVDQCHPFVNPDKEDYCRNLDNMKVGQNIACVINPSQGVSTKIFVDTWFTQILKYSGSVSYYNQLRDNYTNHFTQLIWAETGLVGCGKAKFYIVKMNVFIERLVCNFAPKGNIHGKPVYSTGYPGTQCSDNMTPNEQYKGLCAHQDTEKIKRSTDSKKSTDRSLLRIRILSNDTAKYETEPLENSKHPKQKRKTRHIVSTISHGTLRRASIRRQNYKKSFIQNMSRNNDNQYHQYDRGHSRMYHGYQEPEIHETTPRSVDTVYFQGNNNQYTRNYESVTSDYMISNPNNRKNLQYQQCTRKSKVIENDYCTGYQCLRHDCCSQTNAQQSETFTNPTIPDQICPCVTTSKCPIICPPLSTTNNNFNMNFKCIPYNNMPNMFRKLSLKTAPETSMAKDEIELIQRPRQNKIYTVHGRKEIPEDINDEIEHIKFNRHHHDYIYHSFDSSLRKKRQYEGDIARTPFWKRNDLSLKRTQAFVKYTTLPNLNNQKRSRSIQSDRGFGVTEFITIKSEQYPHDAKYDRTEEDVHTTEQFLSFDELMHLRKFSDSYMHSNIRRHGGRRGNKVSQSTTKPTTKPQPTTVKPAIRQKEDAATIELTNYTLNTQFDRKKYCTRKLTCTWTAFSGIDGQSNGNRIKEFGSRTPPGYVEGCSRTSTCTRDFMNRNKIATLPGIGTADVTTAIDIHEGDDYCEKRSLNIRKRNSDFNDLSLISHQYKTSNVISRLVMDSVSARTLQEYNYVLNKKIESKHKKKNSCKV